MSEEYLEVVDDNDEVIAKETRKKVHQDGLLHREIHVWFVTPNQEIVFQHRAKDKDTYPDLLDPTVGGHVDPGMNYEDTAIKEMAEETGIHENIQNLVFVKKMKTRSEDAVTNTINYAFKKEFAYIFKGNIQDLLVEPGKALGFEAWKIDKFLNLTEDEKKMFVPGLFRPEITELIKDLQRLVSK